VNRTLEPENFRPDCRATLIGSLPLTDYAAALDLILQATPHIPLWPQLPARTPVEGMMNQFIAGFPGIIEQAETTYFDTSTANFETDLLAFYEDYLAASEDPTGTAAERFALDRERAGGIHVFKDTLPGLTAPMAVKGQITGPFTMLTGLTDAKKRLGFYDPTIHEMMVKGLAARAAWQVRYLRALQLPVLLFIDEPALAGLGSSSFIGVSTEAIGQDLSEVIDAIRTAGGLAGIHVCANTDWNLLLGLDLDILSFDAYGFFDRLLTCRPQVLDFLKRGGMLAWGLIPTGDKELIRQETTASLLDRFEQDAARLAGTDLEIRDLLARVLITPSCGTGSLPLDLARRVLDLTREVSTSLRQKYHL